MAEKQEFSKYERARIIGARGLQVSMDAPLLININEEGLSEINYDPLKIAEKELDSGVLPISVNKPMPEKKEDSIGSVKIEKATISDAKKEEMEKHEYKDIVESGEIMQLTDSIEESETNNTSDKHTSEELK